MVLETIRSVLGWSAIFNLVFITVWFFVFTCAHDALLRFHGRWFKLESQTFDAIHYAGMAFYKVAIWLFFIMPYFALCLAG